MANSYDVYTGFNALGLLQVDLDGLPSATSRPLTDVLDAGETTEEGNILRNDETFTSTTGLNDANQAWNYVGNVLDPETGEAIGFYAVRGFLSNEWGIFVPAGTGNLDFTITVNIFTGAGLDTETGWLINEGEALCFVQGTMIATPQGERAVETLAIGDMVLTACGREVPVKWIGRQAVYPRAASARPNGVRLPVRIGANALGQGLPVRDLDLSADHAVKIGGYLVNAAALVNGDDIRFLGADELPYSFVYYHVETEDHDLIVAQGMPSETFVDYVGRRVFDNHAEYLALYGAERIIREQSGPRISAARQLPDELRALIGLPAHDAVTDADHAEMERLLTAA